MMNPVLAMIDLLERLEPFMVLALVLLGLVVVVPMWAIVILNTLIRLRNAVKNAFAQIDVQLQRRYDLIPNIVEVCKGYMAHERDTLEAVIAARSRPTSCPASR